MNRSYSKIRHIQEANRRLDEQSSKDENNNFIQERYYGTKSEKEKYVDLLEKQRLIESKLSDNDFKKSLFLFENKNRDNYHFLYEQETTGSTEGMSLDAATESEYMQEFIGKFIAPSLSAYTTPLTNSLSENYLLNEQGDWYFEDTAFWKAIKRFFKNLGRNIKNSDFADWLDDRFNGDFKKFNKRWTGKFKNWLEDTHRIRINIGKNVTFVKDLYSGRNVDIGVYKYKFIGKNKPAEFEQISSKEPYEVKTPPEQFDDFIAKNEKPLLRRMSSNSKTNWEKLKADTENRQFAVSAIEYFNTTFPTKKWKKIAVGQDMEQFKKEIEKEPDNFNVKPEEIVYPAKSYDYPLTEEAERNLFKDNEWTEPNAENFKKEVASLCADIAFEMNKLNPPEGKPKAYLNLLWLEASASRFRNGGNAYNLSFLELSNNRLNTGLEILKRELSAIGVVIDANSKIDLNPFGGNGDGTTGPNPPIGYMYVPKGNYKMDPACGTDVTVCNLTTLKGVKRSECGNPHATKQEYEQYKYVRGGVQVIFNDTIQPEPIENPGDEVPIDDVPNYEVINIPSYPIYFYAPGRKPFRIPLIGLRAKWEIKFDLDFDRQRRGRRPRKYKQPKKFDTLSCPVFE
jgi:hypothetical protein